MNSLSRWAPLTLSLLRLITGLLFMEHGTMKLLHFPVAQPGAPNPLPPLIMVAGILELVGGALIALGLFTRPVAFILSGQMAVAYFVAHASRSPWPAVNMGEAAILYCFIFFYLVFAGPGSISLDAMMRRRA
jgi:putative oxidoreductase